MAIVPRNPVKGQVAGGRWQARREEPDPKRCEYDRQGVKHERHAREALRDKREMSCRPITNNTKVRTNKPNDSIRGQWGADVWDNSSSSWCHGGGIFVCVIRISMPERSSKNGESQRVTGHLSAEDGQVC
ncbi:uncharacterized protein SPSK_05680 [Sporothrix schenckii 1099-18]|uniref:Uncharacterized protein n=1 Tax=Sporothrix schenckii 1099-18 TaxID=1397361 RepID=A0A0F2LST9_SPOSC|nr:uncharacterized protein SPSK_05680 [Sporothrix schenckii 1099-18]KJR80537.1 hypothetical protein SPSK_05680 [Sporothrix schenckii 1099-18]